MTDTDPAYFDEQIKTQIDSFNDNFNQFTKLYTLYNKKPSSHKASFETLSESLKTNSDNFYKIITNIQTNINQLEPDITALASDIDYISSYNDDISDWIDDLENERKSSKIMINDIKSLYNNQYYKNVQLFVGIIAMITISVKIFRS